MEGSRGWSQHQDVGGRGSGWGLEAAVHGPFSTWPAAAEAGQGQEGVGSAPLGDFGGLSKQGLGVTSDQDTGCWLRTDSGMTRTESAREEVRLRLRWQPRLRDKQLNWKVEPVTFAIFRWVLREREEGRRDGVWEKGKDRSEQGRLDRGPGGDGTDTTGDWAGERRLGHKCWPRSLWPEWTGEARDP